MIGEEPSPRRDALIIISMHPQKTRNVMLNTCATQRSGRGPCSTEFLTIIGSLKAGNETTHSTPREKKRERRRPV